MTLPPRLEGHRDRLRLAGGGAIAAALLVVAARPGALIGWLAAFLFWSGLAVGTLLLALMSAIIPGPWRDRLAGAGEAALPLLALAVLAALPVLIGLPVLYGWASREAEAGFRGVYLTPAFFVARTLLFFAVSGLLALCLRRFPERRPGIAAAGLIVLVPLQMVVATDWVVSLDPAFHSSGFGLYLLSIQVLSALCGLILLRLAADGGGARDGLLGGLLLTALMLWAYFAFMPYFISWSNDLPPIVRWYRLRGEGGWAVVEWLVGLSGLAPAALLLFAPMRRSPRRLAGLCLAALAGRFLEAAWLVLPQRATAAALSVAALGGIGLGCVALAALAAAGRRQAGRSGLVPDEGRLP